MSLLNPKLGIIGYGSMGKEIERLAAKNDFEISGIYDIDDKLEYNKEYEFDVAVEFTYPGAVIENIKILAEAGKDIVIGTTGWYDKKPEIENIAKEKNIGIVWGSNFSIGMRMFFRIIEDASKLADKVDNYDIMLHEMHHSRKKDSPSGTAISLAEIILKNFSGKNEMLTETSHDKISSSSLHVSSTRGGDIPGTHTIYIDSEADTLELIHRARNRSGFASGALLAAKWIYGKKGFFEFETVLNEIWK